ncbi:MAG: hypothetical protein H6551_00370 [Chitinophagales bacterium]|nr:hypothetical protein [Chitinophagaceae bacterium]MCB9063575.1 hypothetical protein [Chitinophagales bacterium]
MIKLEYYGQNNKLRAAVVYMNHLFIYPPFLNNIYRHKYFDMADTEPQKIVGMIKDSELKIKVDEYFSPAPSQRACSYDDPKNPFSIHVNWWTLNRNVHSICNTLMHQCVHALNAANPTLYFGHGDNSHMGKDNTAPFRIAYFAQAAVANNVKIFESMIHEDNSNIKSIEEHNMAEVQNMLCEEGIMSFYDHLLIMQPEEPNQLAITG